MCICIVNVEDFIWGSSYNPKDSHKTKNDISLHIYHVSIYNIMVY